MPFVIIAKEKLGPGDEKRTMTELSVTTLRIGRGTDNDLRLDDQSVQLHHAVIQEEGDSYVLRDLNVLTLTSMNDVSVKEIVLPEAGTIRIGPYTLRFARSTPTSGFTIEYGVLADVGREVLPKREEKFHVVAAYELHGRYLNKVTISLLAVLVVLGGSALVSALGKHSVFMPGAISMKHRLFTNDCSRCHVAWNPVLVGVPDKTCLSCHSGPPHFSDRAFSPAPQCASCHVEHKGQAVLTALADSACVQCHADLKVEQPHIRVTTTLHSFMADHPEFAISPSRSWSSVQRVRLDQGKQVVDTAAIKLNHHLHLKPGLMGPDGPEQLACVSCHVPDERGAYMRPVKFQRDCMRCHMLDFDDRLPGKTVPHGQSLEEVDRFLRATYAEYYLAQHESALKAQGPTRRLPGASRTKEEMWIDGMVEGADRLLLGPPKSRTKKGKCVFCHMLGDYDGASQSETHTLFPAVEKTAIPQRWLPFSTFDHKAHNILTCVACHEAAPHSQETQDVLLPSIGSCRNCHFEPGGARTQCLTCHVYHDKSQAEKPANHLYSIEELKTGRASTSHP